jgi:hypothetical protein
LVFGAFLGQLDQSGQLEIYWVSRRDRKKNRKEHKD